MRKGNKADFLAELIDCAKLLILEELPIVDDEVMTVFLIDFMAFVNKYQSLEAKTFDDMQKGMLQKILRLRPQSCNSINQCNSRPI